MGRFSKIGAVGLLACLTSCNNQDKSSSSLNYESLSGKPLSLITARSEDVGKYSQPVFSLVIEIDGRKVLTTARNSPSFVAEASALIKSEISDGDDDSITLIGNYITYGENRIFEIRKINVEGHTVDLYPSK